MSVTVGTKRYGLSPSRVWDFETGRFLQRDPLPALVNLFRKSPGNTFGLAGASIFARLIAKAAFSRFLYTSTGLYLGSFIPNRVDPSGMDPDDFGRECCPDEMSSISIAGDIGGAMGRAIGHNWIKMGSGGPGNEFGFHPSSADIWPGPGEIRNDSGRNESYNITYKACPETIEMLREWLSRKMNKPGQYDFDNDQDEGRNCTGWACDVVRGLGGQAPDDQTLWNPNLLQGWRPPSATPPFVPPQLPSRPPIFGF